MLHEFLIENRAELIGRCRAKVAARRAPLPTPAELEHGVPLFLDQVTDMLAQPYRDLLRSPAPGGPSAAESRMEDGATRHGEELRRHRYTLEQVVHDYGDLCQAITELAHERDAPVTPREFGMLSMRLDIAIAGAVTEFARQRGGCGAGEGAPRTDERLGVLASRMLDALDATLLAVAAIKAGGGGFGGATAAALDSSLLRMHAVIDRTLAECGPVR